MTENLSQNNASVANRKELFKALAQFHQNLVQPSKNAQNPFLKNNYVTLEGVQNAVDKACKGTGLSYVQQVFDNADGKSVVTRITHESGQSISSGALTLNPQKKDPQTTPGDETVKNHKQSDKENDNENDNEND